MRRFLLISALLSLVNTGSAQFEFERLPISFDYPGDYYYEQPEGLCFDPRDSSLVISGRFKHVNDSFTNNIIKYKDGQVIYLPMDSILTNNNYRFVHYYKGALYLASKGLAKIDSSQVTVLDTHNAAIYTFYNYHDTLLIGGQFDSIAGLPHTGGLVGYDGNQFFTMYGYDTVYGGGHNANPIAAIAEYDGNLVVGGIFGRGTDPRSLVMQFDGQHWVAMDQGLGGGSLSGVQSLVSHGDYLYAGGVFQVPGYGSDNGIARWDGQHWEGLGNPFTGRFTCIDFIGDTLISSGIIKNTFYPSDTDRVLVMYYDGQWCINMKRYESYAWDMQAYNGDYYIVGSMLGGLYSDSVDSGLSKKAVVRVHDIHFTPNIITSVWTESPEDDLFLYPNPARDIIYIDYTGMIHKPVEVRIIDLQGRQLLSQQSDLSEIDLSALERGCFVVQIIMDKSGDKTINRMIQRL